MNGEIVFGSRDQTNFETSSETAELDQALAKAQWEIKPALKDSKNPHFKSTYADISSTIEAIRETLKNNGLSVTQWPLASNDNRLHLMTRIAFKGQFMKATFSSPVTKNDPQGYGSAITYLRRYALQSILCVGTDDDDGNAASGKTSSDVDAAGVALKYQLDQAAKRVPLVGSKTVREGLSAYVESIATEGTKLATFVRKIDSLTKRINQASAKPGFDEAQAQTLLEQVLNEIRKG